MWNKYINYFNVSETYICTEKIKDKQVRIDSSFIYFSVKENYDNPAGSADLAIRPDCQLISVDSRERRGIQRQSRTSTASTSQSYGNRE